LEVELPIADLFHSELGQVRRRRGGGRTRGRRIPARAFRDEGGQAALDVHAAGVDLLDPLQYGDGLGREPLRRQVVRHLAQQGDGLPAPAGGDERIRQLQAQAAVPRLRVVLGPGQLDGLAELLAGHELGQAGGLPFRQPVENHAPPTSAIGIRQVRPGFGKVSRNASAL